MYTQSFSPSFSRFHSLARTLNHSLPAQQSRQAGSTEPGVPRPVSGERFQKVVDRHLLDTLEKAIGVEGISLNELNPDDFTPGKITDRVLEFVNQAFGQLQNSQSNFDKEAFFSQVRQGIDTGFKDARDILTGLGVAGGRIGDNIDATYDQIQQGLLKLESGDQTQATSSLALQSQAAEFNRSAQIEIMTQEGDVIKIGLAQSVSKNQSVFNIEQDGATLSGFQSNFSSSSSLTVSIEGNLNEDEQASLKHLLKQMDKVGHAFFKGDVQAAFHHAGRLGIDGATIAGVSMNLETSRSVQAVAAYQQTRLPEQNVQPDSIKQVSDFFNQAREMLKTARSTLATFENPLSAFNDLFAGVNQAGLENSDKLHSEVSSPLMNQLIKPLGQSILNDEQSIKA